MIARLRICVAPKFRNPYQQLLARHLEPYGVSTRIRDLETKDFFSPSKINADILHLHWLHMFYRSTSRLGGLARSRIFILFLRRLRFRGVRIVVTVHNVLPHEMKYPEVDLYVRRAVVRLADVLIFHDDRARNEFTRLFGQPRGDVVIPHPVYPESLVPLPEKRKAREYFGIKHDGLCALFFGRGGKQKGYDIVLENVERFNAAGVHVILAGRDCRPEHVSGATNCSVLSSFLPDYELPPLFAAADVVLLPYRSCTTSGVAVLAAGFGKPAVYSDLPAFAPFESAGLGRFFAIEHPEQLVALTAEASALAESPSFLKAVQSFREENRWEAAAEKTYRTYRLFLEDQ